MVTALKRTPLYPAHLALGARMIDFAGWELPVQYESILKEHHAVRSQAGLFDVSHLGRIRVRGEGAIALLHKVLATNVEDLPPGHVRYCLLCDQRGGILDDPLVYRLGEEEGEGFILSCNAANTSKVFEWLTLWAKDFSDVSLTDCTMTTAMLALQGPQALEQVEALCPLSLSTLAPFSLVQTTMADRQVHIARTGYTGEDGFELMLNPTDALSLWETLLGQRVKPCGLGARDTLRLEAGMLLYGRDIDATVTPYEARLGRLVHLQKEDFPGKEALLRIKQEGVKRRLVGFQMVGPGIPRPSYPILDSHQRIGRVTSGSYSPTLNRNIGLGYVPLEFEAPDTRFDVEIRGKRVEAEVVRLPFYSRLRQTV